MCIAAGLTTNRRTATQADASTTALRTGAGLNSLKSLPKKLMTASAPSGAKTGVTRGKKLVVLIGQRKALGMAVRNSRTENRFSGLLARLGAHGACSLPFLS
jgi:hypothetical protein